MKGFLSFEDLNFSQGLRGLHPGMSLGILGDGISF